MCLEQCIRAHTLYVNFRYICRYLSRTTTEHANFNNSIIYLFICFDEFFSQQDTYKFTTAANHISHSVVMYCESRQLCQLSMVVHTSIRKQI